MRKGDMTAGKNSEGHSVVKTKGRDGVTEVTTFVKRGPKHPAGPGITTITHYER